MSDLSCDLQLAALERLSDGLVSILVDLRSLRDVAKCCIELKDVEHVFDENGDLAKGATHERLPPEARWAFQTLSARANLFPKRARRIQPVRQKVLHGMQQLPEYLLDALTKLHGRPWRAAVVRDCLDRILRWPASDGGSNSTAPQLPETLNHFVALSQSSNPCDRWTHHCELLGNYLDDLHAVRVEVKPIAAPAPISEVARGILHAMQSELVRVKAPTERMEIFRRKEKEFGLEHSDSVFGELCAASAIVTRPGADIPEIPDFDFDLAQVEKLLTFQLGNVIAPYDVTTDANDLAPNTAPTRDERATPWSLEEFLDELENALIEARKRKWFQGQVLAWINAFVATDENGYLSQEQKPWPPSPVDELSVPARCAALAAIHDEYFPGPRLFPLPDAYKTANDADATSPLFEAWTWLSLTDAVRTCHPRTYLHVLRTMLRVIEMAWNVEINAHHAHRKKLFPRGLPDDPDLVDAIVWLDSERGGGEKDMQILRRFTSESLKSCPKARSLQGRIRKARQSGRTSLPPA